MNLSLWKAWYTKVYGYFYKRVNDKFVVEELTANTMNTVFLASGVKNFQAYTWKVAHNYLVKYIKLKNTEPMVVALTDDDFILDEEVESLVSKNYVQKLDHLKECLKSQLKPNEQAVVELAIYEDKNSTEIGKILDIKPGTVRQKLARSLNKLRDKCRSLWQACQSK